MRLVIGNKNYSSWSMRPWVLLDAFEVPFIEKVESLGAADLSTRLAQYSDSARVPVLNDGEITVWDSLAICEYVNDAYLEGKAWPSAPEDRAVARSLAAEMHSGFEALRNELPMNCRARRYVELSQAAKDDIQRIDQIWSKYARVDGLGDLRLCGQFSIADCFFAPVVMRFVTYDPELSILARSYMRSMRHHPSVEKWLAGAMQEDEVVDADETGVDRS